MCAYYKNIFSSVCVSKVIFPFCHKNFSTFSPQLSAAREGPLVYIRRACAITTFGTTIVSNWKKSCCQWLIIYSPYMNYETQNFWYSFLTHCRFPLFIGMPLSNYFPITSGLRPPPYYFIFNKAVGFLIEAAAPSWWEFILLPHKKLKSVWFLYNSPWSQRLSGCHGQDNEADDDDGWGHSDGQDRNKTVPWGWPKLLWASIAFAAEGNG